MPPGPPPPLPPGGTERMDVKDCERKGWEARGEVKVAPPSVLGVVVGGAVGVVLVGVDWWTGEELTSR